METYLYIIKLVLFLIAFICAGLIFYRYKDKLKPSLLRQNNTVGLKKRDTLYLGYKKFITLVEFENYSFLIGVGDKEISILHAWKREGG